MSNGKKADGRLSERIRELAREAFGYDGLRPGQEKAIRAVVEGRDALVVMPTGSGKSAIYQVAGLMVEGKTVVVSPLLALQRDQVEALTEYGAEGGEAEALNSTLGREERRDLLERAATGKVEFLFLAPEQFSSGDTLERLRESPPSLFVIDEAHCVTEWGHDFRPDYLQLKAVIESLGEPRILALTATAAAPVREEIVERLGMKEPEIIVHGFDRPNLELSVERMGGNKEKLERLLELLPDLGRPGIVYVATRQHADELAERLEEAGYRAAAYHAGRDKTDRERVQSAFMDDELEVIVATTAFGMGVDKPHVAFVIHYDITGSLDAYYQQIGRAGRDGTPAAAILLYQPDDVRLQRFLNSGTAIDASTHERIAVLVESAGGPVDAAELREATGLSVTRLQTVLNHLEEVGALEVDGDGTVTAVDGGPSATEAAEAAQRLQDRHKAFEKSRVEMMRSYAETEGCRRAYLLSYFGESYDPPCGNCDRCEAGQVAEGHEDGPYPIGSQVMHESFGDGQVVRYEEGKVVVLFDEIGYQTLALDIVRERGILRGREAGAGAAEGR
ncbi:MAG TPA: ATP-dependent DNA helicase RecQ [Trueperaceae bacterium]